MNFRTGTGFLLCQWLLLAAMSAADFGGDGAADECKPTREPLPLKIIGRKDRAYTAWKKEAPEMKGGGIELGTEAGIDILLYWDGKRWQIFAPDEDP